MKRAFSDKSGLIILNQPLLIREKRIALRQRVGLAGRYRIRRFREKSGTLTHDSGWFNNLITNIGLNKASDGGINYGYIGEGTAAPNVTDVSMAALLAYSTTLGGNINPVMQIVTPPYYCSSFLSRRYAAGVGTGVVSEVGMGWNVTSTNATFSRALVLDANGDPTSIAKASTDIMDVVYELVGYLPDDLLGEYTITNSGTHDTLSRPWSAANASSWDMSSLIRLGALNAGVSAFSGDIASITGNPTGSLSGTPNSIIQGYVDSSLERVWNLTVPIGNWNGSIRTITASPSRMGAYQCQFDPPIVKDSTQTLSMSYKVSWGRYTP